MQFERWSSIEGCHARRRELLATVSDDDLAFSPGGQAMTLGELCREMGEIQQAYVQSFQTFTQDFAYRTDDPILTGNVERLKAWYLTLEAELQATLETFSAAEVKKRIARPGDFAVPSDMQVELYVQALLIFCGKMTIYLRVLNKPLPPLVASWIG